MKHLIHISDLTKEEIKNIFSVADEMEEQSKVLAGNTIALFIPETSVRTRMSLEKGIKNAGGQVISFPCDVLDTEEDLKDLMGYLENWADAVVVRHKNSEVIEYMAKNSKIPVINAMSDEEHPCEILADMYTLSKERIDFLSDSYLFVGPKGNIGYSYFDISKTLGLKFVQCCPKGFEMPGAEVEYDLVHAIQEKDIVITDCNDYDSDRAWEYQITCDIMDMANDGAILNPCPPFIRGREVSSEVIESDYFVGYGFKKNLIKIELAVLLHCMGNLQEGMSLGWLGEPML